MNTTPAWRYSAYEIGDVGGEARIMPAANATIQPFDAWEAYEMAKRAGGNRPYEELLRIVGVLGGHGGFHHSFSWWKSAARPWAGTDVTSRILTFCNRFGLLGILPHRHTILCREMIDRPAEMYPEFFPTSARFHFSGCWRDRELRNREVSESIEFWKQYTESLADWSLYAAGLAVCIDTDDFVLLNKDFLRRTSTVIERRGKDVVLRPTYPSLLSALAMMAAQDLAGGSRILRCAACASLFVTSAYQAKYCSLQCQWRNLKARARAKGKVVEIGKPGRKRG